MYKKFLLSVLIGFLFMNQSIQCMRVEKSTTQKIDNLNAWMIWATSKEYTLTYCPNDKFDELGIEPMMGKIKIDTHKITINKKNAILTDTSCAHLKTVEYNALNDIACGVDLAAHRYVIYHYRIFENKNHKNIKILAWLKICYKKLTLLLAENNSPPKRLFAP